jgi:hypothetical protein
MKHSLLAVSIIGVLLAAGPITARADSSHDVGDATQHLLEALTNLGVTVSVAVIKELGKAAEDLAKEHVEAEVWRGPAIEPDEYVGGFNLKLYPKGKSRSDEHFKAGTYYRLDSHGLKELEFSTSRQ